MRRSPRSLLPALVAGEWRSTRSGSTTAPLQVEYTIAGDAVSGIDFQTLAGSLTIPAGQPSAVISVPALPNASDNHTIIIALTIGRPEYHVGCPSQSLIVIRK